MTRAPDHRLTISQSSGARFLKRGVARLLEHTGLLSLDRASREPHHVVAVHYHGTPLRWAGNLAQHLRFYSEEFECLDEDTLLRFLAGALPQRRPGIVISFDDGVRDNAEVAATMLEDFGLRGWFMLPGAFIDDPSAFASDSKNEGPPGWRTTVRPMSWDMARDLVRRGHVIGCHTWSHRVLGPGVADEIVEEEVSRAKEQLQTRLGHSVRSFAWVRGRPGDFSAHAHRVVARSFDLAFLSTGRVIRPGTDSHALHRFNVEASFSLPVLRFQISRFNEAFFARRRRAVEQALQL